MAELALQATMASILIAQVGLIWTKANTASQNKSSCVGLAQRVRNLGQALPAYHSADSDKAMSRPLRKLKAALDDALALIQNCQCAPGIFGYSNHSVSKEQINEVETRISNCFHKLSRANQDRLISRNEQQLAAAAPRHHRRRHTDDGRVNVQRASDVHVRTAAHGGGASGVHARIAVDGRGASDVHVRTAAHGGGASGVLASIAVDGRGASDVHVRTAALGGGGRASGVHVRIAADGRGAAACDVRVLQVQHPTTSPRRSSTAPAPAHRRAHRR